MSFCVDFESILTPKKSFCGLSKKKKNDVGNSKSIVLVFKIPIFEYDINSRRWLVNQSFESSV